MTQAAGVDVRDPRLTLLVAGNSPTALSARSNLSRLVGEGNVDRQNVSVIDVLEQPKAALHHRVFFTPTLIVNTAAGTTTIVGDLAELDELRHLLSDSTAA